MLSRSFSLRQSLAAMCNPSRPPPCPLGQPDGNPPTVEVKASLDRLVSGNGLAAAAVGKRTLIVEPAKLAKDASF